MQYLVIEAHRSEFSEPITFVRGTRLKVGEAYEGDEGWSNWYFCEAAGQQGGWVPEQVIRRLAPGQGVALEDYTARELDVEPGQRLLGGRRLNGWVWCSCVDPEALEEKTGWVPLHNLQPA